MRVDGTCVVVELRLSNRTHSETLNERIAKLKRSHLQLIDHFPCWHSIDELRRGGFDGGHLPS